MGFLNKIDKGMEMIDKGMEAVDKVSDDYHKVRNTINTIKNGRETMQSDWIKQMDDDTKKMNIKCTIWFFAMILICLTMLITTIVMCIQGNDIVLQWFGLH